VKYTPIGLIDRYKARLVAQGFSQVSGAYENLEMRQIDVASAYPRSKLHATVYMRPPKALKVPKGMVLHIL
jgi:hypothetical protein